MKLKLAFIFLVVAFSGNVFGQVDENLEEFTLMFNFKYKDQPAYSITISQAVDFYQISFLNTTCEALQNKENIADRYSYDQLVTFIQEMDLANFSPNDSNQAGDTNLQIECRFSDNSARQNNYFHFLYNPFAQGEETRLLELFIETIENNISRSCHWDVMDQLKKDME